MLVVFADLQDLDESGKLNYIIKFFISKSSKHNSFLKQS
jgi:hypothetical protein